MIDLAKLEPIGRKQWVKRKYDEYQESPVAKVIERARKNYEEPTDTLFNEDIAVGKWKATVDKKVNYLLARPPVLAENQELLDNVLPIVRETAKEFLLRGSLIWIIQGDGEQLVPTPLIMNDTIAIYNDEYKEETMCFIRKYIELEVEPSTGEEQEIVYYELYYKDGEANKRDTYCYILDGRDKEEVLEGEPLFIELGKTGDSPLYAYVENLLKAFNKGMKHQDTTVEKNTKPLTEVKGYSGTSDEDLVYAIEKLSIARTDGNGGVVVHMRSMDSASIDMWMKRISQEYYEITATVGKDNELAYAQSGKAIDRLFVDMENSARELAEVLENALIIYFNSIGYDDVDIVWNTDRPVDDLSIINGIQGSVGILSRKTIIEQHPWVDDVGEELKRVRDESLSGMEDLYDEHNYEDVDYEYNEGGNE